MMIFAITCMHSILCSGDDYIYKGNKESRELFSDIVWEKYPINQTYRAVWFSHLDVDNDGCEEVVVRFLSERSYRYFQEISVFDESFDTKNNFSVNAHKDSLVDIRLSEYALKKLTKYQLEKYSTPIKSPPRLGSILLNIKITCISWLKTILRVQV